MGQQITDWSVIENEVVQRNCAITARSVSRQLAGVMEYDDLLQEAYILCATNPAKVRTYLEKDNGGYLNRWLWLKLTTVMDSEFRKFHKYVETIDA